MTAAVKSLAVALALAFGAIATVFTTALAPKNDEKKDEKVPQPQA